MDDGFMMALAYLWSPLPLPLPLRLLPRRRTPHPLRRHRRRLPHLRWRHTCGGPIVSYLQLGLKKKIRGGCMVFACFCFPIVGDGAAS